MSSFILMSRESNIDDPNNMFGSPSGHQDELVPIPVVCSRSSRVIVNQLISRLNTYLEYEGAQLCIPNKSAVRLPDTGYDTLILIDQEVGDIKDTDACIRIRSLPADHAVRDLVPELKNCWSVEYTYIDSAADRTSAGYPFMIVEL